MAYIVFGVLGFMVVAILSSGLTYRYLIRERANSLYSEATLISSTYSETGNLNLSTDAVSQQLKAVSTFLDVDIWIVDRNGKVLSDTAEDAHKNIEIPDFDSTMTGLRYKLGRYHDLYPAEVLSVMAPVTRGYTTGGYVLIHEPVENIVASQNDILNIVYLTALIIFILSLLIMAVFYVIVYRPLKRITEGATKYAAGDYHYKITTNSEDEMGYLAETLNFMSDEISKSDDYQKQFIANVSHDFRSPLTSIKGYVEAILDGTIPPEMQEKYLRIVLMETERLNKLTSGLLTLNSFDTKKNRLDITDFDINAVIKDTAASFEGTCTKKRISISLILASRTLYVCADMGKIQQVLYNLIDNAIKFSNNDSTITVETTEKHGKVFVSVKDTGCGIPKASITKIWERFYKLDASRGKDRKGTGLGLSIVKEIIAAHNQNINVISTEGVGTEFIFTLAKGEAPK